MDDDSRWTVGLSGQIECVGYLVEADDRSDAGQWIQSPRRDGVESAVPILRVRAAAELDGDALTGRIGDAQRITGVPPTGAIDPRAHVGGLDDLLDQACGADTFEDHQRTPQPALGTQLAPHVERRLLRRIDRDVRPEAAESQ